MCIAVTVFVCLTKLGTSNIMSCRQWIAYQLTPILLFGGFLPVLRHLIGYFCWILAGLDDNWSNLLAIRHHAMGTGRSHPRYGTLCIHRNTQIR